MYMFDLGKIEGFEWDRGNIDKNIEKHGIAPNESEEVFLDERIRIKKDFKHQETEERSIAIGRTIEGKILFEVFTLREYKIRIISSRLANKKERRLYEEKAKENTKI